MPPSLRAPLYMDDLSSCDCPLTTLPVHPYLLRNFSVDRGGQGGSGSEVVSVTWPNDGVQRASVGPGEHCRPANGGSNMSYHEEKREREREGEREEEAKRTMPRNMVSGEPWLGSIAAMVTVSLVCRELNRRRQGIAALPFPPQNLRAHISVTYEQQCTREAGTQDERRGEGGGRKHGSARLHSY